MFDFMLICFVTQMFMVELYDSCTQVLNIVTLIHEAINLSKSMNAYLSLLEFRHVYIYIYIICIYIYIS